MLYNVTIKSVEKERTYQVVASSKQEAKDWSKQQLSHWKINPTDVSVEEATEIENADSDSSQKT